MKRRRTLLPLLLSALLGLVAGWVAAHSETGRLREHISYLERKVNRLEKDQEMLMRARLSQRQVGEGEQNEEELDR